MLDRLVLRLIKQYLGLFPAVSLLGPRQCGKTTLARLLSSNYFDLESEGDQVRLDHNWDSIMGEDSLIVLDEAQAYPKVFSRLRGAIDKDRKKNGRFLILGSIAPELILRISQSLAGRVVSVPLCPLVLIEVGEAKLEDLWIYGGFPDGGVLSPRTYPVWHRNYLQRLIYIDFEKWGFQGRPQQLERILKMLAVVNGQQWNASQIGKSLGVNYQTVNSYVDFLEGAFLIRKLKPYYRNIKKRLVKSSKLYFRDTGVLHSLLNVESYKDLFNKPWVGSSWEGFVIENIINTLEQMGVSFNPYYLRTSDGYEIDLILEISSGELWTVEVKMGSSASVEDLNKLTKVSAFVASSKQFLISQTKTQSFNERGGFGDLQGFLSYIRREFE